MPLIPIERADDPRIALYHGTSDPALLGDHVFVAEGRLVVERLFLESTLPVHSVLVTEAARASLSAVLERRPDVPVYVAPQPVLNTIAGFNIHRGCLALGARPAPIEPSALLDALSSGNSTSRSLPDTDPNRNTPTNTDVPAIPTARVLLLEAVSNADNVGGLFRSAAALGAAAVLLGPGCCDPLYRKAIRTSIGATLVVPFAPVSGPWGDVAAMLRTAGFLVVALTPAPTAMPIADAARRHGDHPRVAILAGAEGAGLSTGALDAADVHVRIPMTDGVDSLNVNVAVAITLHRFARLGD